MMWGNMMGWGAGPGFGLGHLLLWGLLIAAAIAVARLFVRQPRGRDDARPDRAIEILKERYARGEIDKAEFDRRRSDLAD